MEPPKAKRIPVKAPKKARIDSGMSEGMLLVTTRYLPVGSVVYFGLVLSSLDYRKIEMHSHFVVKASFSLSSHHPHTHVVMAGVVSCDGWRLALFLLLTARFPALFLFI